MINHIRTLLLDEEGSNKPGNNYPLEEFVPTSFKPAKMKFELRKVWNTLFGNKPDRAYKNWRLFQLSELAQASNLIEHWQTFDKRITHFDKPAEDYSKEYGKVLASRVSNGTVVSIVMAYANGVISVLPSEQAVNQTNNQEDLGLLFTGKILADEVLGRSYSVWQLDFNAANYLDIKNLTDAVVQESQQLSFTQGLSQAVELKGTGLDLKFKNAGPASWTFDIIARPSKDIGVVLANLDNLPKYELEALFTGKHKDLAKFKDYWFKQDELCERMTAISLALAYRLEERRES